MKSISRMVILFKQTIYWEYGKSENATQSERNIHKHKKLSWKKPKLQKTKTGLLCLNDSQFLP